MFSRWCVMSVTFISMLMPHMLFLYFQTVMHCATSLGLNGAGSWAVSDTARSCALLRVCHSHKCFVSCFCVVPTVLQRMNSLMAH